MINIMAQLMITFGTYSEEYVLQSEGNWSESRQQDHLESVRSLHDSQDGLEGVGIDDASCVVLEPATTEDERHGEADAHRYHDDRLASKESVEIACHHVENDVTESKGERN